MLFDSHCHLNFSDFENNYQEIIADCLEKGIGLINIGADYESSKRAVAIANEYPDKNIYASIGIHPTEGEGEFEQEKFQELIDVEMRRGASKIVAVGEIGLDYYYKNAEDIKSLKYKNIKTIDNIKRTQREEFVKQLNFAQKNNLPVVLHARGSKENPDDAYLDILEVISLLVSFSRKRGSQRLNNKTRDSRLRGNDNIVKGVVHCFDASLEIAQKFVDFGFYIGLTGIITFKNKSVDNLRQVVKMIPLERILVETDAPWLTPEPYRGEKNTPQNVEFVALKVAELKGVSYEEVCRQTTENVKKLFFK
ncbi:hypothetical protein COU23_01210 [Candidatus Kuenenbacteria bacterium CG10_big_fil_rev_8_21_14_0_10_36_11]|uniref:Hydrolase TatD n=1 Tax=Candidatus Kuenenbacteria bacterium CG10_big_fil_rev_8_21_14_0_10_36_11 TaxID=1974618 RepID=A0A2M6WAX7_9BACT|nr:MAG: hypothetical protein COU23_01210 [Candidatus Kuenenbacteria bacterium CG10_big_fil_rev_8_21_14_0_10_36_11]